MDLYYLDISPPCRAVLLTSKALNIPMNIKVVDLLNGEHRKPEFLALNPEHTIPTMVVDNDFVLWESTAIQRFLVNKQAHDHPLYPKEPRTRAQIDRLLHFSTAILCPRYRDYVDPFYFEGSDPDPALLFSIREAIGYLNKYLEGHDFAVGNLVTIADHSLIPPVTDIKSIGISFEGFPNVTMWYKNCEAAIPDFKTLNEEPAEKFGSMVRRELSKRT